jgi:hypothetical protein
MRKKTVRTYIKKLVKVMGGYEAVGSALGITPRYVRMLEQDGYVPSEALRKLILLKYYADLK